MTLLKISFLFNPNQLIKAWVLGSAIDKKLVEFLPVK
jgi:hypothetical protein